MVAPVCRIGDPLRITCTASVEFIRWNILELNEHGILEEITNSVQINSRDPYQMSQRVVKFATFTFMRNSAEDTTPLISTLSIDSVNISLNGTIVRCSDIVANPMISVSTAIYITDTSKSELVDHISHTFSSLFLHPYN